MKLRLYIALITTGCVLFIIGYATRTQAFSIAQHNSIGFVAGMGGIVDVAAVSGDEAHSGAGTKPQIDTHEIAPLGFVMETTSSVNNLTADDDFYSVGGSTGQYQPIGEIIVPTGEQLVTRAVEEKDGYAYLLTRGLPETSYLYTYNVSNLPSRTDFTTYNSPIASQQMSSNGNGLLRNGDYLYAFGYNGLSVLNIQNPASPTVVGSRHDLLIYNLVKYNDYLIAPGYGRVAIYSISNPANPILLSIYSAANKYFFSAAVYNNILYTSEFEIFYPGPTYTFGFRVINISDPSNPYLEHLIGRDSASYHLRTLGNKLIECDSGYVRLWSLDVPTNPVFRSSRPGSARVCALDGNNIVVNGTVFRVNGDSLETIESFDAGFGQPDGFPYGSAITPGYVFLAQSPRVLILKNFGPIVGEARLDIGMPYNTNRGCSSPYVGCGGPFHGFYAGVCTDLAMDAYSAGATFNIQNHLYQDHLANPGRYRYGTARNSEDMRRYFNYNQQLLPHSQSYQLGDIALFDWNNDGITDHANIVSEVDGNGRPLKMVDATGVYPGNPSGLAFEHNWSNYYDQHSQGHARLSGNAVTSDFVTNGTGTLQVLRITVYSPSVALHLSDANGKSTSETYDENLVASNVESFIPYIPGGSYSDFGTHKVITVTHPLSNTIQYFARLEGQANVTYNVLIETLEDFNVSDTQLFTETIGIGESQGIGITLSDSGGILEFTASSPTNAPFVSIPTSLEISGLVGTSGQLIFSVTEAGGQQPISNVSVSVSDLADQLGGIVSAGKLSITPTNFSVAANDSQSVTVQVDMDGLEPGVYQGGLTLTSQNAGVLMIPFTLEVQFHNVYLPVAMRN